MKLFHSVLHRLAIVGIVFFAGITSLEAQKPASENNLKMIDANHRVIGSVVRMTYSGDRAQVALELPDLADSLIVVVYRYSIHHITHPFIYFESQNCSGPAYLSASISEKSLIPASAIAGRNQSLYISDESAKTIRSIGSILNNHDCKEITMETEVLNAVYVTDLADEFVRPYTLE